MRAQKAASSSEVQMKGTSFLDRANKGRAMWE